ncbi:MAG TPA: hypothetical protein VNZ03_01365 [Terriglobales bacterium]|jgi:hypothetical protein|nr:hypothetical protein [Terriglobales bacterium]
MSDLPESGESGSTSTTATPSLVRETHIREQTEAFLQRLFEDRPYLEELFRKICGDQCAAEEFGTLLYTVSLISSFRADPKYSSPGQELLLNSRNISKAQLKALPKKLRNMADMIDKVNATIFAPANDIKLAPFDAARQIARDYMIRRYESLPGFLRVYSCHLERFSKFSRQTVKRLTLGHVLAIQLIRYVEDRTGSPHYADMSNLLEQGWLVAGRTESAPSFLSEEGLTKLYQRWADAICGPRRTSRQ